MGGPKRVGLGKQKYKNVYEGFVRGPEGEFMNTILSQVFWAKLKSSETRELVGFSTFVFPFMKKLEST
jgi:hypothetical protein